jgi:hypothetical protein
MDRVYGWWCPACQVWLTRNDVRQTERDEVSYDQNIRTYCSITNYASAMMHASPCISSPFCPY